jgi:hypothetical protein
LAIHADEVADGLEGPALVAEGTHGGVTLDDGLADGAPLAEEAGMEPAWRVHHA